MLQIFLIHVYLDQITVTGGGAASPSLVMFPGAYKATDPGILIDIHASVTSYVVPGPTVYAGGSTKSAGGTCVGVEALTAVPATTTTHARRRHL
jgi:lytic cellulose monooxygenase (C1-hydroxylating)